MITRLLTGPRHLDLPLAGDATGRLLAAIIGLMVLLASLALAAALVLSAQTRRWEAGASTGLTVQISPAPTHAAGAVVAPLERRVEAAVTQLRASPLIAAVERVPPDQVAALLAPWLGETLPAELPVPALIDARLGDMRGLDVPAFVDGLAEQLARSIPGARLERHSVWLGDLVRLSRVIQGVALAVLAMVSVVGILSVIFAVHSGLAVHRELVELLHVIGATDAYISRQFERHVLDLAERGAVAGSAAGIVVLVGLEYAVSGFGGGLMPELTLAPLDWLVLAVVPVAACLVASGTARWTVLRTLAALP